MPAEARYGCPECRAVFRWGFARCPLDGAPIQELVDDPLVGSTFADRYIIEDCVGEGGMGRVYRARHRRVSRRFAIKILFGDSIPDPKTRDRFAREAEAASRLSHPNVISVVDFGENEHGLIYLVMDWVEGRDLATVIAEEAPLSRDRILNLLGQLAGGLSHAHGKGLIHRDFKSDNVILCNDGRREVPKIVDFGIAMINESVEEGRLTTEGTVIGTPAYMAPEQSTGEEVDHRCDLFALGVLAYEMLSGGLPFDGTPLEIARQNLVADAPPIAERATGVSADPGLEALAQRLMAKRPDERLDSADEVERAVEELAEASGRAHAQAPAQGEGKGEAKGEGEAEGEGEGEGKGKGEEEGELEGEREAAGIESGESFEDERRPWRGGVIAGAATLLAFVALGGVLVFGGGGEAKRAEIASTDADAAVRGEEKVEEYVGASASPSADGGPLTAALVGQADKEVGEKDQEDGARDRGGGKIKANVRARDRRKRNEGLVKSERGDREREETSEPEEEPEESGGEDSAEIDSGVEAITPEKLQLLYEGVGRSIAELRRVRKAAVGGYEDQYLEIPIGTAIRNDSLRPEVYRKLIRLRAAVRKELSE